MSVVGEPGRRSNYRVQIGQIFTGPFMKPLEFGRNRSPELSFSEIEIGQEQSIAAIFCHAPEDIVPADPLRVKISGGAQIVQTADISQENGFVGERIVDQAKTELVFV